MRYTILVAYVVAMLGVQCRGDADGLKHMLYNFSRLSHFMDVLKTDMDRLKPLMDGPPDTRAENYYAVLNTNMNRVDRYWYLYLDEIEREDGTYTVPERMKLVSAFKDLTRKREVLAAFMDEHKVLMDRKRFKAQQAIYMRKLFAELYSTPSVSVDAI